MLELLGRPVSTDYPRPGRGAAADASTDIILRVPAAASPRTRPRTLFQDGVAATRPAGTNASVSISAQTVASPVARSFSNRSDPVGGVATTFMGVSKGGAAHISESRSLSPPCVPSWPTWTVAPG